MSYSDYGSYNWLFENEKWVLKPQFEDTSLISQITGKEIPKELTEVAGIPLKIEAVKQSMEYQEQFPDLPFEITGTHHSVIGDLENFAVVSYKGTPKVLWKGKVIDSIFYDDVDEEFYNEKNKEFEKKENFKPKVIHIQKDYCEVKVIIDTSLNFWSIAYVKNLHKRYLSICGYGLGDHWWLTSDGKEIENDFDEDVEQLYDEEEPLMDHWPREEECLNRCLQLLNLNI